MRNRIRHLILVSGPLGLLLVTAVVAMSGLSLMDRALISLEQTAESASIGQSAPVSPVTNDRPGGGNMAHDGRSAHWPSNSVLTPLLPKTDQTESRIRCRPELAPSALIAVEAGPSRGVQITTTSAVNSLLGRQHTLVGARPSGTS